MKTEYDLISSSKLKIDGQVAPEDILPVNKSKISKILQPVIKTLKRLPTLSEKLIAKMKTIG